MNLYVIRHGQSTANENKVMAGHANVNLTEKGKEQAEVAAQKLKNIPIDIMFCSPLNRALDTAKIINSIREKEIPMIIKDELTEVDYGIYEGVKKSNFDYNSFWDYSEKNNINQFFKFAWPIIRFIYCDLMQKYFDKDVLLVTHGGVTKILEMILGDYSLTPKQLGSYLPNNSEILKYSISGNDTNFVHNERSIKSDKSEEYLFQIITPNIIGRASNEIKRSLQGEMLKLSVDVKPKIRNRLGIILYNDKDEIAITKYKNTNEVKLIGGSIDYSIGLKKTIEKILDERFGYEADFDNYLKIGNTIEIKPSEPLANVVMTEVIAIKFKEKVHELSPNEKEVAEGFSIEWLSLDEAIQEINKSFNLVKSYNKLINTDNWRPLITKQSIVYRDKLILEYYRDRK